MLHTFELRYRTNFKMLELSYGVLIVCAANYSRYLILLFDIICDFLCFDLFARIEEVTSDT